jgi:hypothetical protein
MRVNCLVIILLISANQSRVFAQTNASELLTCNLYSVSEWRLNKEMQESTKTFSITNESAKAAFSIICRRCHLTQNLNIEFDLVNLKLSVQSEFVIQGLLKVLEVLYIEKQLDRETSIQFEVDKMPLDFRKAFCTEASSQMKKLDSSLVAHRYDEDRTGQIIRRAYQNIPQVKLITQYLQKKKFKWLIYYDEHPLLALNTPMKWHNVANEPNSGIILKSADGFLTFSPDNFKDD